MGRININSIVSELSLSKNLKWYRKEDYRCIEAYLSSYDITICKYSVNGNVRVSYFIDSSIDGFLEDYADKNKNSHLLHDLISLYDNGIKTVRPLKKLTL